MKRNDAGREYEFYAFISYKRGEDDEIWAKRLQNGLESYRVPVADFPRDSAETANTEGLPKRLRVFRDKSDLGAHPKLNQGLAEELDSSRFLVVVCSARSAESPWVDAEVRHFLETGRENDIIPFDIEPRKPGGAAEKQMRRPPSLPADIEGVSSLGSGEEVFLRLLARLLRVDYDNLRAAHLRASRRRAGFALSVVAGVMILVAGLIFWAVTAERRAAEARAEAEALAEFLTFDLVREASPYIPSGKFASITGKALEYYARWEAGEPREEFARAVNLRQAASAMNDAGDSGGALGLYLQALELLENPRKKEPFAGRWFAVHSEVLLSIGKLFEAKGFAGSDFNAPDNRAAHDAAVGYYLRSLDAAKAFSEAFPDSPAGYSQIADSLEALGQNNAGRGNFREADTFFSEAESVWKETLRRWPKEAGTWLRRAKYANFQSARAYAKIVESDFRQALSRLADALEIFMNLHKEDPKNLTVRLMCADELSTALFVALKYAESAAPEALEDADMFFAVGKELWRSLVEEDPQRGYVFGWAGMLTYGGLLRIEQGRGGEAEALLDEAEDLVDGLLSLWPDEDAYLSQKALIGEYRGRVGQNPKMGRPPISGEPGRNEEKAGAPQHYLSFWGGTLS
jgi:hypothetical protein